MASKIPYDTISSTSNSDSFFTKCCFCVPLRTGCFILGYLSLVCNMYRTFSAVILTLFVGVTTHGFDHFDQRSGDDIEDVNQDDHDLKMIEVLLMMVVLLNLFWLSINIACLVGLHNRRPGPIRTYVGFATGRLFMTAVAFIYLKLNNKTTPRAVVVQCLDLGLSAYFILVYYIYAVQLETELRQKLPGPKAQPKPAKKSYVTPIICEKNYIIP